MNQPHDQPASRYPAPTLVSPETTAAPITRNTSIKFLTQDGTGPYSGFPWPLPHGDQPGDWVTVAGDLVACAVGLHFTTLASWRQWRNERAFVIEADGPVLDTGDKSVCGRARLVREIAAWNPRTLRLFAVECAERVLHLYEAKYPDNSHPREALAVARRYANGTATADELRAAYRAARSAAADAYAAAAAYAAYAAAYAAYAAAYAAYADAYAAAADAYAAAADAYAYADAEREWQDARLMALLNGEVSA